MYTEGSKPAGSPISQSAGRSERRAHPASGRSAGWETRDTADWEVCGTPGSSGGASQTASGLQPPNAYKGQMTFSPPPQFLLCRPRPSPSFPVSRRFNVLTPLPPLSVRIPAAPPPGRVHSRRSTCPRRPPPRHPPAAAPPPHRTRRCSGPCPSETGSWRRNPARTA